MTQAQNAHNRNIDMMVQSLHSHRLTNSDVTNHSVRAKESCCFENQGSILAQSFELAKLQILKMILTIWQVIPFLK